MARIPSYLLVLAMLFVFAYFATEVNELPITHPGNIKAADPFYHTMVIEMIMDTEQWKYYPDYVSFGVEGRINQQPPLLYVHAAQLAVHAGVPSWVAIYFIVAFFFALNILLVYLIVSEVFQKRSVALGSAALSAFPLGLQAWYYQLYIGFWIQVLSLASVVAYLWFFVVFHKRPELKAFSLIGMGFTIGVVVFTHPQELMLLFLPSLYVAVRLASEFVRTEIKVGALKNLARFVAIPVVALLVMAPWFLFVWKTSSYSFAWNPQPFSTEYLGGLTTPGITYFPWYILLLFVVSMIFLIARHQSTVLWLGANLYFLFFVHVLPFIVKDPHYIGRMRSMLPFLVMPTVAYGLYVLASTAATALKNPKYAHFFFAALCIVLIIPGYLQYKEVETSLGSEHITPERWKSYLWIEENTPSDARIFFLSGCYQSRCLMTKRISAVIQIEQLVEKMQQFLVEQELPLRYHIAYVQETLWDYPTREVSRFKFEPVDKVRAMYGESYNATITDFEYVVLEDLSPEFAAVNRNVVAAMGNYSYAVAYQQSGITILRRSP